MAMDKVEELEWAEAQKIGISKDLVAIAKQQLEFLAAVDRQRFLYEGPLLERAIHRYKNFWLPLLAKHAESGVVEGSLVAPLDCEWIWHCHRLNPVQYKKDCEKLYGSILDNENVESSFSTKSKFQSTEIWTELYPGEPFELDYSCPLSETLADMYTGAEESITYDLVSAVKRQSVFYYQVARPSMHDSRFLEGAVARYKGFLHLIKKNQETSMDRFCVPTYDIDLIWHSHQLQPRSYCKDMLDLLGKILGHDDTDADRTKGKKLDTGFTETTKQWEDTYGSRYWRAGAMYRGNLPSPLDFTQFVSGSDMEIEGTMEKSQKLLPLHKTMAVEVLLEIMGVRNLPADQTRNLFVSFSKKRDMFLSGSCTLSILSECGKKQVAGFQCEPKGEIVLELMSNSNSHIAKTIGTTSIPLQNLMDPNFALSVERWFELKPHSGNTNAEPVSLYVAASFTVPFSAPQVLRMYKSGPISMNTCFFPFPGKVQQFQRWVRFVDDSGNDIISLQMRNVKQKDKTNNGISKRTIVGLTRLSRKPHVLAEYAENKWSLKDYNLSLCIEKENSQRALVFELTGDKQIKLFPGKKLKYEPKNCHHVDLDSITAVEFSADHPYGRAIALLDTESSLIQANEEQFVLPAILLLFILKKEGYTAKNINQIIHQESKTCWQNSEMLTVEALAMQINGGGCGGGCSSGCGNVLNNSGSGGCGSGCGGGCGSGCGNVLNNSGSGGCGGGCGGGSCGNLVMNAGSGACKATMIDVVGSGGCGSGCGGGCGGGCGKMIDRGGGCGGGCGGGECGNGLGGDKVSVGEVVSVAA